MEDYPKTLAEFEARWTLVILLGGRLHGCMEIRAFEDYTRPVPGTRWTSP